MASVKIVLRKKQNKDNTYPLALRITKDRKASFVHLGKNLFEKDWDPMTQRVKKSHPNSSRYNQFILKKLSEATDNLLERETTNQGIISAKTVSIKSAKRTTFFTIANGYLDNFLKSGKYNRYYPEQSRVNQFKAFLSEKDIQFEEITIPLLKRFMAYLKGKNLSDRTVMNHLLVIRTIFNQAIKGSMLDRKHYPFGKDMIHIKFPSSMKIGLDLQEVKSIEDLQLEKGSYLNHCRNLWLFSFYFAGMRISDVLRLRWSDFQNDRLHYQMGKNAKGGSLKISDKALKILSQYEKQKRGVHDFIFPELKEIEDTEGTFEVQRIISYATKKIDNQLTKVGIAAGINKKLTMHIARHTFGNISGEKISIQMLQKLYRHSSVTTTIAYQANFIHKDADEALDAVVNF